MKPSRHPSRVTRREFLKTASAVSVMGAAAPFALNMLGIGTAAAQAAIDYKALVCVFLFGGRDHYNTVVPYDLGSYDSYANIRATPPTPIALDYATLLEIVPNTSQGAGLQFALPQELPLTKALFDAGKMAIVANVGPLVVPTTLAEYRAKSVPLPPKLFSHNDQQSVWQALGPEGTRTGWGGRLGDIVLSQNTTSTFTCISASGNTVWLAGDQALQYQVSNSASIAIRVNGISGTRLFGSSLGPSTMQTLITSGGANLAQQDHSAIVQRSINATSAVTNALAAAPALTTVFPSGNSLATQLQTVARLISVRDALGAKRQVFFVSLGGFDTHDNENTRLPALHAAIDGALSAFYQATVELGLPNEVTLFTASDFGRTLTSNGDGSDHGWGSHHFIVGGAVKGKDIYGTMPTVALSTNDDAGQGRLIPTTSVDQYAATLATWFGVSPTDLTTILPNLGNFSSQNLGFFV